MEEERKVFGILMVDRYARGRRMERTYTSKKGSRRWIDIYVYLSYLSPHYRGYRR